MIDAIGLGGILILYAALAYVLWRGWSATRAWLNRPQDARAILQQNRNGGWR